MCKNVYDQIKCYIQVIQHCRKWRWLQHAAAWYSPVQILSLLFLQQGRHHHDIMRLVNHWEESIVAHQEVLIFYRKISNVAHKQVLIFNCKVPIVAHQEVLILYRKVPIVNKNYWYSIAKYKLLLTAKYYFSLTAEAPRINCHPEVV